MLLTEQDLASWLGVSVRTVQGWRQRGVGIPFVKLGKTIRYDSEEVERFLAKQNRVSTKVGAEATKSVAQGAP